MNKKIKEKLTSFLVDLFNKSNILQHELLDLDDNDINFLVIPKIDNKKLKNTIKLQLIIYCSDDGSLTIYCPLIYKLQDTDTMMFTLNAINEVNNRIALGKIYLNRNNNSVISYVNKILFNNIINELTPELLNEYIEAFILCCVGFYGQMKQVVYEQE